jgi:hypothetical protein
VHVCQQQITLDLKFVGVWFVFYECFFSTEVTVSMLIWLICICDLCNWSIMRYFRGIKVQKFIKIMNLIFYIFAWKVFLFRAFLITCPLKKWSDSRHLFLSWGNTLLAISFTLLAKLLDDLLCVFFCSLLPYQYVIDFSAFFSDL